MKTKELLIAIFTLVIIGGMSNNAFAQKGVFKLGPAVNLVIPTGDFSSKTETYAFVDPQLTDDFIRTKTVTEHGTGFGIAAAAKYGLSDWLSVVGQLGWNASNEGVEHYGRGQVTPHSGDAVYLTEESTYNFVTFTAGIRANVSFLYAEGQLGYFSGDQGGFGFVPAIGAEFGNFDLQVNYAIVGEGSYFGARLAYYFTL